MPKIDCSVYVTFQNHTDETLVNGRTDEVTIHESGKWIEFPSSILPHSSSSFKLVETAWFTGTSGNYSYEIIVPEHKNPLTFQAYQRDAYTGTNAILCYSSSPPSVYALSFAARVADREWKQGDEPPTGHPVYVTYTLEYAHNLDNHFRLLEITAISAYPVRNSRGDLITGQHTLWKQSEEYIDKNDGTLTPNIFKYKFGSQVAASGILDVKVRPVDKDLLGADVILYATKDGKRVIQSDYFTFPPGHITNVTVQAHVIEPATSAIPFLFNAEVNWVMELRVTKDALQCLGPGITRLELYWIADTLHPAFQPYVPVTFLRNVLGPIEKMKVQATNNEFYQAMTKKVFNDYNKRYDTVTGEPHFGADLWGGNFNEALYLRSREPEDSQPGTYSRTVNCMDQAAMLELSCSFLGGSSDLTRTIWLYQFPFGYINTTHLVGVKNDAGAHININNPLFGTDINLAELDTEDQRRRPFGTHVYIGHSLGWNMTDDGIYDACSGPHLGTENIDEYLESAIDSRTNLYGKKSRPGTYEDIGTDEGGIRSINLRWNFSQNHRTIPPLSEPLSHLVSTAVANTVGPLAHTGWAHLPIWLNATLGHAWDIQYEQVSVGGNRTQALWLISNPNIPDNPIRINISVASVSTQDGHLDMEQSATIVKENICSILVSTERQGIWTSGALPGFEGVFLHYADHVAAGRIVIIAGNVVMDIAGMTSYEELLPYTLKLLDRTVRRLCRLPPIVPVIQRQAIRPTSGTATVREPETATGIVTVIGIDTRFSLVFSVSCTIATADAGSEGHGILFDRHVVEELDNGEGCTVEFRFIARKVGRHRVHVCVADSETMIAAESVLEVEVVSA